MRQCGQPWPSPRVVRSPPRTRRHRSGASCGTPTVKLDRIHALGARWELVDGDFDMARERVSAIADRAGIGLVEDSLDIETCKAAATIGLELVDTAPPDAVLIALGDGALATGIGYVIKTRAPGIEVICIQPAGAPAMTHSLTNGAS